MSIWLFLYVVLLFVGGMEYIFDFNLFSDILRIIENYLFVGYIYYLQQRYIRY